MASQRHFLGILLDLASVLDEQILRINMKVGLRETLQEDIQAMLDRDQCTAAVAAKLRGRLTWPSCGMFGKWGERARQLFSSDSTVTLTRLCLTTCGSPSSFSTQRPEGSSSRRSDLEEICAILISLRPMIMKMHMHGWLGRDMCACNRVCHCSCIAQLSGLKFYSHPLRPRIFLKVVWALNWLLCHTVLARSIQRPEGPSSRRSDLEEICAILISLSSMVIYECDDFFWMCVCLCVFVRVRVRVSIFAKNCGN